MIGTVTVRKPLPFLEVKVGKGTRSLPSLQFSVQLLSTQAQLVPTCLGVPAPAQN